MDRWLLMRIKLLIPAEKTAQAGRPENHLGLVVVFFFKG